MSRRKSKPSAPVPAEIGGVAYDAALAGISDLLARARRAAARSVNSLLAATYWEVGRRIVEFEQRGKARAEYGERLWERLAEDLTARHGRGFSKSNLALMRSFYLTWEIFQTPSGKLEARARGSDHFGLPAAARVSVPSAASGASPTEVIPVAGAFPLSWSQYVSLLSVESPNARAFYEAEALRGGWSVRQLSRQIGSQFYERALLSRQKAAMLKKGEKARPGEALTPEEELKDPFVLEFLDLKDEYSELELEEALIRHLESFLLELGNDFTFVGRQRRLRIGDQWFRVDLVFFHRVLRCLIIIDLKLDKLTPGDIGQMNLYVNYARHHWTHPDENPPVGLILCAEHDAGVAKYALEGLPNKILASQYRTALPSEELLTAELERTRKMLEGRTGHAAGKKKRK